MTTLRVQAATLAVAAYGEYVLKRSLTLKQGGIVDETQVDKSNRRLKRTEELASGLAGAAFFSVNVDLNKVWDQGRDSLKNSP